MVVAPTSPVVGKTGDEHGPERTDLISEAPPSGEEDLVDAIIGKPFDFAQVGSTLSALTRNPPTNPHDTEPERVLSV